MYECSFSGDLRVLSPVIYESFLRFSVWSVEEKNQLQSPCRLSLLMYFAWAREAEPLFCFQLFAMETTLMIW
ncbi:hypothetical protein SLEP1_g41532 [Rubroshorea leprosula]|uniref:Uncharacterized protein n=1 Tax=Rubroshorea leprosula TaxID=152421 RepID=A0AAV5L754_9ROSI|nr:hypothetical protein SLEP1_g41532 [Rubroshorea leprosula]